MRYCSTCGAQTDGTAVHYCNPIPVAQLTAQLAAVTAERDALKTTLDIMRNESLHSDRYDSEREGATRADERAKALDEVSRLLERRFQQLADTTDDGSWERYCEVKDLKAAVRSLTPADESLD